MNNKKQILKITDIQYQSLLENVNPTKKRKLVISEQQYRFLENAIVENHITDRLKKQILMDLDMNYEPASGMSEMGNEFFQEALISKKVNGETISPKLLFDYLNHKYNGVDKEYMKQIITDWYHGTVKEDGGLTKNVKP